MELRCFECATMVKLDVQKIPTNSQDIKQIIDSNCPKNVTLLQVIDAVTAQRKSIENS